MTNCFSRLEFTKISSKIEVLSKIMGVQLAKVITTAKMAESIRDSIDLNKSIPNTIIDDLKEAGIFKSWLSKLYGGEASNIIDLLQTIRDVSYYESSLGWMTMVSACGTFISGFVDKVNGSKIFEVEDYMLGGSLYPYGMAIKKESGIVLSGSWKWGTGIHHCSHILAGFVLMDKDNFDSVPRTGIAFLDPNDIKIKDDWNVLGLRGTESHGYTVEEKFIPASNWIVNETSNPTSDEALFRCSTWGTLAAGIANVGLGIAKKAIDEMIKIANSKIPAMSTRKLADRATVQSDVAKCEARYHAAKNFLDKECINHYKAAEQGIPDAESKKLLRLAASNAVDQSVAIVDFVYRMGGGSSIMDNNIVQQLFRDINVVRQHGLVSNNFYETLGKVSLGLHVNPQRL